MWFLHCQIPRSFLLWYYITANYWKASEIQELTLLLLFISLNNQLNIFHKDRTYWTKLIVDYYCICPMNESGAAQTFYYIVKVVNRELSDQMQLSKNCNLSFFILNNTYVFLIYCRLYIICVNRLFETHSLVSKFQWKRVTNIVTEIWRMTKIWMHCY